MATKKKFDSGVSGSKDHSQRTRFDGGILLTDRSIRKHSVLKDVQGIGLDLLPEYQKSSLIDEKYKSVEDMEVILSSETILGHEKDKMGYLPSFVYQIVGLQPRGTKTRHLVECPYQILQDEALNFPYDTSFRRAALNVEFQPQFDVLDAPWILDQCLRYRQMLEMNDMMEGKKQRSNGIVQTTHRYPVDTRGGESYYDVTTRRMEHSRAEPYSSSRRVRSYTAKSGPDSAFKDLLTGFYGTAFYGSGYCSTDGGYPLYGYNYIGKPYASIHGLYGDSHLSSNSNGNQQETAHMTITETTTTSNYRDKLRFGPIHATYSAPRASAPSSASMPPPPRYVPRARREQSVTEVTTTTTTTTEEQEEEQHPEITQKVTEIREQRPEITQKVTEIREHRPEITHKVTEIKKQRPERTQVTQKIIEIKEQRPEITQQVIEIKEQRPEITHKVTEITETRPENKDRRNRIKEPDQKRWKTITEETIQTVSEKVEPKVNQPDTVPPQKIKKVKPKPLQQMVTICTYDSKQGSNSDPLFQASTTKTVITKANVPEIHHGVFTHSAPAPLDIEPTTPPPPPTNVVRNAMHYYKVEDDDEGQPKSKKNLKTVPEVKVKRETITTTTKLSPEAKVVPINDSTEDVSYEEYTTTAFQPILQKASSYPDLQQEMRTKYTPNTERSKSMHHLSPQDSTETMEPEELGASTDSITYVFVNRAQSLKSMTAEKQNKKNQLSRPVSEPDWEVITSRESRSGLPSKDTSDTCIQTSGSLENLYWTDYPEESTTTHTRRPPPPPQPEKNNVRVINLTSENRTPQKKPENEPHRPKEIRYVMYDEPPQHHRQPAQQAPNIVYKIISRDDEPEERPTHDNTNHHIEIRKRSHHYRDVEVVKEPMVTVSEEEAILSIARAYLSDNMGSVANHVQRVNGLDSIYYGDNRVIVVDQQRQGGDKRSSHGAPRSTELQIVLPSRNGGKNLNNVNIGGLRDRQISEIIDNYLQNRHLEKQETEGTEKNHKNQIVSDHLAPPDESSVFVIHDNGSTHDSNGSSRPRTDGVDRTIYARDKDGLEHGYRIGYTNDIHGAVNIYIHEVPQRTEVVHRPQRAEAVVRQPPANFNHNVTIHVKHDKEEPVKRHVFHSLPLERTRIDDSMNTLDLSFSSSDGEAKPTKGWTDELEKLRLERLKILSLVGKDNETCKLQVCFQLQLDLYLNCYNYLM